MTPLPSSKLAPLLYYLNKSPKTHTAYTRPHTRPKFRPSRRLFCTTKETCLIPPTSYQGVIPPSMDHLHHRPATRRILVEDHPWRPINSGSAPVASRVSVPRFRVLGPPAKLTPTSLFVTDNPLCLPAPGKDTILVSHSQHRWSPSVICFIALTSSGQCSIRFVHTLQWNNLCFCVRGPPQRLHSLLLTQPYLNTASCVIAPLINQCLAKFFSSCAHSLSHLLLKKLLICSNHNPFSISPTRFSFHLSSSALLIKNFLMSHGAITVHSDMVSPAAKVSLAGQCMPASLSSQRTAPAGPGPCSRSLR